MNTLEALELIDALDWLQNTTERGESNPPGF